MSPQATKPERLDPKRILIVDDDRSLVESLGAALAPPYRVRAASNGRSALALLRREGTDLIILDLHLGDEDGLDLLPRLREMTPAPVLLLTGFGSRENLLRSIRAKPDDFLDKPVSLPELRGRVASLIEATASDVDALERVRAWIDRDFHRPLTAETLARSAGMTPDHLRRMFAERFGITPRTYLEQCRMNRATALLRDTDSLVKEIAIQVGFSDANNFSTAFKRLYGVPPDVYRAEHRPPSPG